MRFFAGYSFALGYLCMALVVLLGLTAPITCRAGQLADQILIWLICVNPARRLARNRIFGVPIHEAVMQCRRRQNRPFGLMPYPAGSLDARS
jgi:hypothetical protein